MTAATTSTDSVLFAADTTGGSPQYELDTELVSLTCGSAPSGGRTPVRITDYAQHVSNPDGIGDFDVTGSVDAVVDERDQSLDFTLETSGSDLTISGVSGCSGLFDDGEIYAITASYALTNPDGPLHVTSP